MGSMTSLNQDISNKLKNLNGLEKLIAVNVVVFLIVRIISAIVGRFVILDWLELPSDFYVFLIKPWTLVTYSFLHYDFFHILFNMLWLYFVGKMFLTLFNVKLGMNVYFLGAISGGLLYLLGYNVIPSFFSGPSRLVGASAAVRALLIFICAYSPYMDVRMFTFKIKLWHIGVAVVVIDILGLFGANSGGNLAHLGGAILGYGYAVQLRKGNDIGKGFEKMMDSLASLFSKKEKSPLRTVHKTRGRKEKMAGYAKEEFNEFNTQKKIDVILDKISKSGYDSLTKEEKEFLFRAGK